MHVDESSSTFISRKGWRSEVSLAATGPLTVRFSVIMRVGTDLAGVEIQNVDAASGGTYRMVEGQ